MKSISRVGMALSRAGMALIVILVVAGCQAGDARQPSSAPATGPGDAARTAIVFSSPTCACCHEYVDVLRADAWNVSTVDVLDMSTIKAERRVPDGALSCHTMIVEGYVVEGHVPLAAIERLLAERPSIDGIALAGMPSGSPGMGGEQMAPFEVLALKDGTVSPFGSY